MPGQGRGDRTPVRRRGVRRLRGKIAALGHPVLGQALRHASTNAFLRGLTVGCLVAGAVAAAGALLAVLFLPAQPAGSAGDEAETAEGRPKPRPKRAPPQ